MRISDWSSDVCSSDLLLVAAAHLEHGFGLNVRRGALGGGLQLVGQRQREPRLRIGRGLGTHGSGEAGFDVADLCGGRRLPQHLGHRGDALGSHALSPAMASPAASSARASSSACCCSAAASASPSAAKRGGPSPSAPSRPGWPATAALALARHSSALTLPRALIPSRPPCSASSLWLSWRRLRAA